MNQPHGTQSHEKQLGTAGPGGLAAVGEYDADLQRSVRRASYMRQGFYVVVLLVALAGQVSGAVEALHIPLAAAIPAVGALELGGIVVLANADVRRRLGERAVASRLLSVVIAAGAVAFNWLAHSDHLLGGFFAGMSALGYLVWLMHTENQRRDRLRAKGTLAWTTPAYEVVGHWLTHPWLTRRARALAKADPNLGLYDSLAEARAAVRRERRQSAIAKVLHRKIRAAVDPTTADIAVHVYDLDEIALRLADGADYDGLTALIAADLAPARLAAGPSGKRRGAPSTVDGTLVAPGLTAAEVQAALPAGHGRDALRRADSPPAEEWPATDHTTAHLNGAHSAEAPTTGASNGAHVNGVHVNGVHVNGAHADVAAYNGTGSSGAGSSGATGLLADVPAPLGDPGGPLTVDPIRLASGPDGPPAWGAVPASARESRGRRGTPERAEAPRVLSEAQLRQVQDLLPKARTTPVTRPVPGPVEREPDGYALPAPRSREASLRTLVHATLDERVPAGDSPNDTELVEIVTDALQLSELERLSATNYVYSWRSDMESGRRATAS